MLKCSSERWVWAPQSLSPATSTVPRLSVSLLTSVMSVSSLGCAYPSAGVRESPGRNLDEVDRLHAPRPLRSSYVTSRRANRLSVRMLRRECAGVKGCDEAAPLRRDTAPPCIRPRAVARYLCQRAHGPWTAMGKGK